MYYYGTTQDSEHQSTPGNIHVATFVLIVENVHNDQSNCSIGIANY